LSLLSRLICKLAGTVLGVLTLGLLSGCALEMKERKAALLKECVLPTDQSGTIPYMWRLKPIPIQFNKGDFVQGEIAAILAAADTWNSHYAAARGFPVLDYGSPTNPRTTLNRALAPDPSTLCNINDPLILDGQWTGAVTFYKQAVWPAAYPADVMAITTKCPLPGRGRLAMKNAMVELNYQKFFVGAGNRIPDLQTIILHELGHLFGLEHSCEAAQKAGFPDCRSPTLDFSYFEAVLYPTFTFDSAGNGQQKRKLGKNDQGRANCLW
jgi:hypothetical protein